MPTYGYQCTACQHEFSVFQSMKDDPISTCPECGGATKRLLYPVGVVFKGSGWYINDSRKPEKSESASGSSENAADKKTDANSDKGTETTKSDTAAPAASSAESKPAATTAVK